MQRVYLYFLLQLCAMTMSQETEVDPANVLRMYRQIFHWIFETYGKNQVRKYMGKTGKVQEELPERVPFPCNVTGGRSMKIPDSVHRLRPGDIDIIAAMGDSITAGNGIFGSSSVTEILVQNRGASGSGGGDGTWRTYLTLPNILKEYNPKLIGHAVGESVTSDLNSQLNVAVLGALSKDMPFMAKFLVNKMKNDPRIDIKNHWKLISIQIGSNDFCGEFCSTPNPSSILKNHKIDLVNTIRILRDNIPRAFVAIISPPHLREVVEAQRGRESLIECYVMTNIECPCLISLQHRNRRMEYYEIISKWQNLEEEIADYPEFHKDDFTVVFLPVLKNVKIPRDENGLRDLAYLSTDCFHVTQRSNALYANGLWNNLLEPHGNKTDTWPYPLYKRFLCPSPERPFFMTKENSQWHS